MSKRIWIEVDVEEVDSLEPGYSYDPKTLYQMTPVDYEMDGLIEFTCRRSQLSTKLAKFNKKGLSSGEGLTHTRAIYAEPDEEAGDLLRDAAKSAVSGFNIPALDVIVDCIEEAVMPSRVRSKHKINHEEEGE